MTSKISTLKIENFRGIVTLTLPLTARSTQVQNVIIVGENGTGKSSIIDALEFYFKGKIEKLQGRQDIREKECIPHLKGGIPKVEVQLTAFQGTSMACYPEETITFIDLQNQRASQACRRDQVIVGTLNSFFREAASRPFILRRAQLLQFIEARPADRYNYVLKLIGLGEIDQIENSWRAALNEVKRDRENADKVSQGQLSQLQKLLGVQAKTAAEVIAAVNTKLQSFNLAPIANISELGERRIQLGVQAINDDNLQAAQRLCELAVRVQEMYREFGTVLAAYQELHHLWQDFVDKAKQAPDAQFETLLSEAEALTQKGTAFNICPLCEQTILDQEHFHNRLTARLAYLAALTASREKWEQQHTEVQHNLRALSGQIKKLKVDMPSSLLPDSLVTFTRTEVVVSEWQQLLAEDDCWPAALPTTWLNTLERERVLSCLKEIEAELLTKSQELTPSHTEEELFQRFEWLVRVEENWQDWQTASTQLAQAQEIYRQVEQVYDSLVQAKKQGLNDIIKQVENTFKDFYQKLHPNEGYGTITLPISSSGSGSVNLKTEFHTKTEHPLGYFSEGHLDSLGLCIFLAFIKQFNTNLKLVILDDVLTSVDAGHRMRVAQLLAHEFSDYQLFITTHDEMWAQQLATVMKNTGKLPKLVRLKPWTLNTGADCGEYSGTEWDYHRQQVEAGHCQDGIAGTGRALEKFLFQMRRNLRLAVPATPDDRYTLGDLLDPFFTWLDKHPLSRPDLPDYVPLRLQLKMELYDYWRLRNWSGAHFNEWGSQVSDREALDFINIVEELAQLFTCPVCGELVVYNHSLKVVHCPICVAQPLPKVVWQFKPNWKQSPQRLLSGLYGNPKIARTNAVRAIASAFEKFLQDAHFRLGLTIPTTPDNIYRLGQLYQPFFDWAIAHPNQERTTWNELPQYQVALNKYVVKGSWLDLAQLESEAETLLETIDQVIKLFQCPSGHLLNYDPSAGSYACLTCNAVDQVLGLPAHWYVED